jgi:hypothetical protein
MKKDLRKELQEMKFLFGYKPGRVISEQHMPEMEEALEIEDLMMSEPGVMDPEVMPNIDIEPDVRPGKPDRSPGRLPYEDPDTHPQGRRSFRDMDFADPGVLEPEVVPDIDIEPDVRPGKPDRSPGRLPYEDPDTHPQGRYDDDVNEPFTNDVEDFENSDLADLVMKYLNNKG